MVRNVVFNGGRLKGPNTVAMKSDRIDTEVSDHCQSYTLKFGKCL